MTVATVTSGGMHSVIRFQNMSRTAAKAHSRCVRFAASNWTQHVTKVCIRVRRDMASTDAPAACDDRGEAMPGAGGGMLVDSSRSAASNPFRHNWINVCSGDSSGKAAAGTTECDRDVSTGE